MMQTKTERDDRAIKLMAGALAAIVANDLENRSVLPMMGIIRAVDDWETGLGDKLKAAFQAEMLEYAKK